MGALLVKYRNAAQITACPFGLVFGELWVDGFEEWTHEGDFKSWSDDRALEPDVFHYRADMVNNFFNGVYSGESLDATHAGRKRRET